MNFLIRVTLIIILTIGVVFQFPVLANIDEEIANLEKEINRLKDELLRKEKNYFYLQETISNFKKNIEQVDNQINQKEKEISEAEKGLISQKKILETRAKAYYKKINKANPTLIDFLLSDNIDEILKNIFYQKFILDEDRKSIIRLVFFIKSIEDQRNLLEEEKKKIKALKNQLDHQAKIVSQEIERDKLIIAQLTAKQQELIAKKLAENPIPRSAGVSLGGCSADYDPLSDRILRDSGFSPKYGFFSLGAPNKVGMSQFGAYGRSKIGQGFKDILNAYYQNIRFECRSFRDNKIKTQGFGEVNIRDYLKGLGEMPLSWGSQGGYEAFKAQVVAASSYAYSYTNGGEKEICITESCQVFTGKNKGGLWEKAVDEVNQECGDGVLVMVSNDTNEVVTAWYSSTHGGVMLRSADIGWSDKPWTKKGFDAEVGILGIRDLINSAYDGPNHGQSPWFYCNWGSRAEYNKTAWLKEEEVLEVVNAFILFKLDQSTLVYLSQLDRGIPEVWDDFRVRQEIKNRGGTPFSSVYSIESVWDGSGITRLVIVKGDIGERRFDGQEFKDIFNLRARGNLVIVPGCLITKSSEVGRCKNYALYDVVKK